MTLRILKRQPYNPIGPFTQAQMLGLKGRLRTPPVIRGSYPLRHDTGHIFKPWKTGKTYPYSSAKRSAA